jgi:hypothetical protein
MVLTSYHKHPDNFISSRGSWWRSMSYINQCTDFLSQDW